MAKNRVIYQSQAVYAGRDKNAKGDTGWQSESGDGSATHANHPNQLKRVQSANYGFDITRTDVNQFGELARIDSIILESPVVNFDSSWYLCNFYNEDQIGLKVNQTGVANASLASILSDVLTSHAGERNYYIRVVDEGSDAKGYTNASEVSTNSDVIGIGNAFLTNWSCEGAVGGFPTANITVEGMNIAFTKGTGGLQPWVSGANGAKNTSKYFTLPAVTSAGDSASTQSAIKPGDVTLTLPSEQGGAELGQMHVQSFNAAVDMSREPLQKLGSRFAYSREITFPINATMSVDALVSDMKTGDLVDMIDRNIDNTIIVNMTNTAGDSKGDMAIVMKKAKLDSQSLSQSIGDNQTVTYNWSAQIGSSTDTANGLFLSGNHA
jgi:hypothetical protein